MNRRVTYQQFALIMLALFVCGSASMSVLFVAKAKLAAKIAHTTQITGELASAIDHLSARLERSRHSMLPALARRRTDYIEASEMVDDDRGQPDCTPQVVAFNRNWWLTCRCTGAMNTETPQDIFISAIDADAATPALDAAISQAKAQGWRCP